MYCYNVCVSVWVCLQCSRDVLVKVAGASVDFLSIIKTGGLHRPATQELGVQLRFSSSSWYIF